MNQTDQRIRKLILKGLTPEQIARKIGRPGNVERVYRVLKMLDRTAQVIEDNARSKR